MSASIVLLALTIGADGYVLDTAFDDTLVALAAHEFDLSVVHCVGITQRANSRASPELPTFVRESRAAA